MPSDPVLSRADAAPGAPLMKPAAAVRLCLSFGAALACASVLMANRAGPAPMPDTEGIVYVYFPSVCARPGDPSECREITRPVRPSFRSMAACSAYADVQLRKENNPQVMASCLRQHEG